MKSAGVLLTLRLGMAAGAMICSMLPQNCKVKKAVDNAASSIEDAAKRRSIPSEAAHACFCPPAFEAGAPLSHAWCISAIYACTGLFPDSTQKIPLETSNGIFS